MIFQLGLIEILISVPILLVIEGFFSGSEIALLSADRLKLKAKAKEGSQRASLALELAGHPERVLSTTLVMTSLCVIGISSLIAIYFNSKNVRHAELIAILTTSPLIVIFGELLPKTIFQRYADQLAIWVSYPVNLIYWLFFPVTRILTTYTSQLSRLLRPIEEMISGKRKTTRDELKTALSFGKKDSELKPSERKMIKRIFDFKDIEAKHALIPLVKVDAIEDQSNVQDALERFQNHRHSRMPVYSDRIDNIIGVVEIHDLMSVTDLNQPLKNFISPAHYVAETQSLRDLLMEMHHKDLEMVIVVDEYGGAIGILTFEDIVEEIVGEIQDEYDSEHAPYQELSPTTWLAQAQMEIQQINEQLKLNLPEGDYETLGGFLLQQFGRIPEVGDELYFDTNKGNFKFVIRKANERQIKTVFIQRKTEPTALALESEN